jgi:hypothetical protein
MTAGNTLLIWVLRRASRALAVLTLFVRAVRTRGRWAR